MSDVALLEHLRDLLTQVHAQGKDYDHDVWANWCGTAFCAGGYAGLDPFFQKLGLRTEWGVNVGRQGIVYLHRLPRSLQGLEALTAFFDLTEYQADYLFSANAAGMEAEPAETLEQVIARVQEILDGEV